MADGFTKCFFMSNQPIGNPGRTYTWDPLPKRPFYLVMTTEISDALFTASNHSALGLSGIKYDLIKWAFRSRPNCFTSIFSAFLSLEIHPWLHGCVVIIPKPGKPDYAIVKAYCPISLLECCSKILEKVVAHCFSDEAINNLLGPMQFAQHFSSTPDAATLL